MTFNDRMIKSLHEDIDKLQQKLDKLRVFSYTLIFTEALIIIALISFNIINSYINF